MSTTKPPFRADHVGSLLRPPELHLHTYYERDYQIDYYDDNDKI